MQKWCLGVALLSSAVGLTSFWVVLLLDEALAVPTGIVAMVSSALFCAGFKIVSSGQRNCDDWVLRRNSEGKVVWIGRASEAAVTRRNTCGSLPEKAGDRPRKGAEALYNHSDEKKAY